MDLVEEDIVGDRTFINGPFGRKALIYVDHTASGSSMKSIEDFIRNNVLPTYGNTHTESSYCGVQTTIFRDEARDIIREATNAPKKEYAVIFTGNGCTGALHKAMNSLNCSWKNPYLVFVGPFEHHSNILPWREQEGVEVVRIGQTKCGQFNYEELEQKLKQSKNDPRPKVGSFCKASNVTGIITDADRVSTLMHKYGGIVFWDYATAASHMDIDVDRPGLAYKDAVFISTHKFIGGPDTPGILVARKDSVFLNQVPDKPGGGSVMYVSRSKHRYLDDFEAKEESGTPQIVGSIRAGLVFKVRNELGINNIREREEKLTQKALNRLKKVPCLKLLGSPHLERLPIFSFLVLHEESGLYFHHHFINQLLNDLFGIQCRSGCACAGPYAIELLGMDDQKEEMFLEAFDNDLSRIGSLKPGFVRFNLPFFHSNDLIDFILDAVEFVCVNALCFLPLYELDQETGCWTNFILKRSSLPNEITQYKHLSLFKMTPQENTLNLNNHNPAIKNFRDTLENAERMLNAIVKGRLPYPNELFRKSSGKNSTQEIAWFMTQREALKWLPNTKKIFGAGEPKNPVFEVQKYPNPSLSGPKNGLEKLVKSKNTPGTVTEFLRERNNKIVESFGEKNRKYTPLISRQIQCPEINPVLYSLNADRGQKFFNINFKANISLKGNYDLLLEPKKTADVKKFSKNS